jgi:poly(3-hydroxyalkanoate) synthetase
MNEHYHLKYKRLWNMIENNDEDGIERYLRFENWYGYTQKLPGKFYLEVVNNIFKKNGLVKKLIKINNKIVDLKNITCKTIMIAGTKDHITKPKQIFALKDYISTNKKDVYEFLTDGGHIGVLMSKQSLEDLWPKVIDKL